MNFAFLGNGRLGLDVATWLATNGHKPVALILHPRERAKHAGQIADVFSLPREQQFDGSTFQESEEQQRLADLAPEIGISVLFGYVLGSTTLDLFPRGCLNLHPALLPYNRGHAPNVWSIVEHTPSGVTLHFMDRAVDTGDIVAQREVVVRPDDTGETLYRRLETEGLALFEDMWESIMSGNLPRAPQPASAGTSHRTGDVEKIDCIDLDQTYRAGDLIDILRARTFPPYRGAYFTAGGKRIYMRLSLEEEAGS